VRGRSSRGASPARLRGRPARAQPRATMADDEASRH
jgi:hypothetical protein